MATGLESKAVFEARATALGLTDLQIGALQAEDLNTFGDFAYCCSYIPGPGSDEKPFTDFLAKLFPAGVSIGLMTKMRRLYFQAHTMALVDLKASIDRTEDQPVRKLAIPERAARHESQKTRLPGIRLEGEYECSHLLIDKVQNQYDTNEVRYIPPEECVKRDQEVLGKKVDETLRLAINKKSGEFTAEKEEEKHMVELSSDLALRNAFLRRGLAYDQCGILTHATHESWIAVLFKALAEPAEDGFHRVSTQQIIKADQKMFVLLAQETRAGIIPVLGAALPLELAMIKLMTMPALQLALAQRQKPMGAGKGQGGKGGRSQPYPEQKDRGRGKGRGKGRGQKGGRGDKKTVPQGCCAKTADGKFLCYAYNGEGCAEVNVKPGERCQRGYHLCGRKGCHGEHPLGECTRRGG